MKRVLASSSETDGTKESVSSFMGVVSLHVVAFDLVRAVMVSYDLLLSIIL